MSEYEEVEKAEKLVEQLRELRSLSSELEKELIEGHKVGKIIVTVEEKKGVYESDEVLFEEEFELEEGITTYRNTDTDLSLKVKTEELEWEPEDDV